MVDLGWDMDELDCWLSKYDRPVPVSANMDELEFWRNRDAGPVPHSLFYASYIR